jgi:predicted N-acetyltransferase YhbS
MAILYALEPDLPAQEFRDVLIASTLGERRPVGDLNRLDKMLRQADIVVTARSEGNLVGVSRAITDYSYCCYLSDLAVDETHQRQGIGRRLIEETHAAAGPQTTLMLVAAPAAESYYPKIGMQQRPSCWLIPRTQ